MHDTPLNDVPRSKLPISQSCPAAGLEHLTKGICNDLQVYNSTSYLDDLMLAAAWLAESTGRPAYLTAAETYWDRIYNGPNATWQSLVPDWNNQWWAGNVILAGLTGNPRYQVMSPGSQPALESPTQILDTCLESC